MKAISSNAVKTLGRRTYCTCADNSGAKIVELIACIGFKGMRKMDFRAGIADMVVVVIKKGKPELRKKVERGVIVRTRKEFKRANGWRVKFDDNAVVLTDEKGLPKASEVKGVVAKEAGERWPKVAGIAAAVM